MPRGKIKEITCKVDVITARCTGTEEVCANNCKFAISSIDVALFVPLVGRHRQ